MASDFIIGVHILSVRGIVVDVWIYTYIIYIFDVELVLSVNGVHFKSKWFNYAPVLPRTVLHIKIKMKTVFHNCRLSVLKQDVPSCL